MASWAILIPLFIADQGDKQLDWSTPEVSEHDVSPPSSPSFAPVGRPTIKKRFRSKIPDPLRLDVPRDRTSRLGSLHLSYSVSFTFASVSFSFAAAARCMVTSLTIDQKAVTSRIDRADNLKFIEQFRYTIVASQLLAGHSITGNNNYFNRNRDASDVPQNVVVPTSTGILITATGALVVACVIRWVYMGGYAQLTKGKIAFTTVVLVGFGLVAHFYIRQQWIRYLRNQALAEVSAFVAKSQDFDGVTSAALSLIQEVELVSRGYRLSAPLPPISRLEDRSQTRRCSRLRKTLKARMAEMIQTYVNVSSVIKAFAEQLDIEKFHDVYDISDFDISDAMQGFSDREFEDPEAVKTLKIAASRFHTIRKIFLCSLLALEATGDNTDFLRWSTAVESLRALTEATDESLSKIQQILDEEETFPAASDSKFPLSPNRERRRSQFQKLNSLSTGIRGLQAKLALLREESERTLNEAEDVSELGLNLMAQYESIGQDLKLLQQAWEDGKAALASGIDRNEKRLSSISTMLSPATSLSGLTTVEEGGALEAFKALTGESPSSSSFGSAKGDDEAEVFEAVSLPPTRPRSMFTREERIAKMKEERERRESIRQDADASRGMLKELEMVINLRPKRSTMPAPARVSL
ncbi:Mysoin-binding motif of peroxisomes-domain-containing protein [Cercophora samala]|uniref:Vezatin n=1 Tax=Cercophora samala TaxID=330535 RepID=A0AA39ZLK7_9PEZI|nr:Mysoin-binding motif of peroxisomes-domain-containing protein [Cercophora samala]